MRATRVASWASRLRPERLADTPLRPAQPMTGRGSGRGPRARRGDTRAESPVSAFSPSGSQDPLDSQVIGREAPRYGNGRGGPPKHV